MFRFLTLLLVSFAAVVSTAGQVDEICKEFGYSATLDAPRLSAPFVYGRITVLANDVNTKFPKVTITYATRSQSPSRVTVEKSGSYCFKVTSGSGGSLVVDIDGIEVARKEVPDFGPAQKREDFQVSVPNSGQMMAPPGVVSSKFSYPPNEKTADLYKTAVKAEGENDLKAAIASMKLAVSIDANDFIAWAYLGTLYFRSDQYSDADAAYRTSLTLREDYTPAWINVAKLRVAQKQLEAAIEIFKHAAALEPEDARTFRLLGETYLQNKQGTFGAQALNHAIRLDPVGQAECHLQLAHLYQLAKANHLAAEEYRKFLEKVPDHPDKIKIQKFIDKNPRK